MTSDIQNPSRSGPNQPPWINFLPPTPSSSPYLSVMGSAFPPHCHSIHYFSSWYFQPSPLLCSPPDSNAVPPNVPERSQSFPSFCSHESFYGHDLFDSVSPVPGTEPDIWDGCRCIFDGWMEVWHLIPSWARDLFSSRMSRYPRKLCPSPRALLPA